MQSVTSIGWDRAERRILTEAAFGLRAVLASPDDQPALRLWNGVAAGNAKDPIPRRRLRLAHDEAEAALSILREQSDAQYWLDQIPPGMDDSHLPEPMRAATMAFVLAESRAIMARQVELASALLDRALTLVGPAAVEEVGA